MTESTTPTDTKKPAALKNKGETLRGAARTEAEQDFGPHYEIAVAGVGRRELLLPYAWAILFDSKMKGLQCYAYNDKGELIIQVTDRGEVIGDSPEADEFKDWVALMGRLFNDYLRVLGVNVHALMQGNEVRDEGSQNLEGASAPLAEAKLPTAERPSPATEQESPAPNDGGNSRTPRRGRR